MLDKAKNYEILGYTSRVLWHFVRDQYDEEKKKFTPYSAINVFNLIFDSKTQKNILKPDPSGKKYHSRQLQITNQTSNADSDGTDKENFIIISVKEPRAICFADIPFNFLPIHLENYNGIGIGFKQDNLRAQLDDLKPVDYFPTTIDDFKEFYADSSTEAEITLKKYSKIPTSHSIPEFDEAFDKIYLEREWRTFQPFNFNLQDISMIVARTSEEKNNILRNDQVKKMLNDGLAVISLDDFFTEKKFRGSHE